MTRSAAQYAVSGDRKTRTSGSGKQTACRLIAWLISVGSVIRVGHVLLPGWQSMKGWEAYWTAQALSTGNGYSFPFDSPWPFDPIGTSGFHPSAWTDPFYTLLLAGLIRLFGSHHQLAAAVLNLALLLAVFGLTYRVAERLVSPPAGVATVLVLALNRAFSWNALYMNNTMLAATFVIFSALMLARFLAGPSARGAAALGLVLGLTALACPGAQLFIPVAAVAVVASGYNRLPAVSRASILLIVTVLTVSPWAIRNYLALGEFVPGRTGLGHNLFLGVIVPAGMTMPESLPVHLTPPWRAKTARSSVDEIVSSPAKLDALYRYLTDYSNAVGSPGYSGLNEAQRDAWLLQQSKAFVIAHPFFSAQLALAKLRIFIRIMGFLGALVCLLAAIGGVLALKTPTVLTLAVWAGSFVAPFLLVIPFYDRYRAPIEPILVVLAVFAVWHVSTIASRNYTLGQLRSVH